MKEGERAGGKEGEKESLPQICGCGIQSIINAMQIRVDKRCNGGCLFPRHFTLPSGKKMEMIREGTGTRGRDEWNHLSLLLFVCLLHWEETERVKLRSKQQGDWDQ